MMMKMMMMKKKKRNANTREQKWAGVYLRRSLKSSFKYEVLPLGYYSNVPPSRGYYGIDINLKEKRRRRPKLLLRPDM